jgi:hypothetical protein
VKKILFIAPNYYGFNEVVFDGLKKHSGLRVFHIISNENYKYKNFGEKIQNFISKLLFNKNLKISKSKTYISSQIASLNDIDLTIINRPDLLNTEQLNLILNNSKKTAALLWDSLEKIPVEESVLKKISSVLSFDDGDCKKYNFKKITNFYFQEKIDSTINFDVAFLGTYDERLPILLNIFDYLKENKYKIKAKIYSYHPQKINERYSGNIENINKIIPFNSSFHHYLDAFVILDIAQPNQAGLSFRPFEAMGLEKKIITNNIEIKNYDFYNPENIHIITDISNINIPKNFFTEPYKKLPVEISKKYFIENWIKNIIKN